MVNPYLKLLFGMLIAMLGLGYLYRPDIVQRLNKVLKETLLNDSYVALHRRSWGFLLLLLGAILIYMGVTRLT